MIAVSWSITVTISRGVPVWALSRGMRTPLPSPIRQRIPPDHIDHLLLGIRISRERERLLTMRGTITQPFDTLMLIRVIH